MTLAYSQDLAFERDGDINNTEKFNSIWLSHPLQDQEQLDLSHSGQDGGQDQVWACGEYMMTFQVGMPGGCQNIPNRETAECVCL